MDERKLIKEIAVNIIQDAKQTRIAIPSEIVQTLKIDPEKDNFVWSVISNEKHEISLSASYRRGGRNEKTQN